MNPETAEFVQKVRDYLVGKSDWQTVHQYAVDMEYANKAAFRGDSAELLNDLHMIFLADAKDDPQFRADNSEIEALLAKIQGLNSSRTF